MKKNIITAAVFTACLALGAAVWPKTGMVEKTHAPIQAAPVSAPEPTVEDAAPEAEITLPAEEEKAAIPQAEPLHEDIPAPEPVPEEVSTIADAHPTPEPEQEPLPAPEPTPVPTPPQTVTDPQPGDMVYVPGFGWLETQGPNEVIHDKNMYENGNKIGIMG